jgi:hypothetical protein
MCAVFAVGMRTKDLCPKPAFVPVLNVCVGTAQRRLSADEEIWRRANQQGYKADTVNKLTKKPMVKRTYKHGDLFALR